jgi:uncharacterized YigZ family protein
MSDYMIPAKITFYEQSIKRSRFLTWIYPSSSPEIAKQHLKTVQQQYPDARHICWAWIAGAPNTHHLAMSDDGEPAGTAGKPMLNVLQHKNIGEITAIVVRYFGGIKLGTGGLSRAYSSSVSEALKITPLIACIQMQSIHLACIYAEESRLRRYLDKNSGVIDSIEYQENVQLLCQIPLKNLQAFQDDLPFNMTLKILD